MAQGGEFIDRPMAGDGDGPGGAKPAPVTGGSDPSALQLTQLLPANPSKGWNTSYYPVYTDQGDVGAVIPGTLTNQRVRLIDPSNGSTLAEGVGNDGAQQIATLANALGKQLQGKAAYNIQVEMQPDQFSTVGGDDVNHPHANLLKTLVQIGAPLLGAAIPGLGPILGAALGGFGGSLATGSDLKGALMSALTSGLGNSLGGAAADLFKGVPVSFAGTNALGGLLGHLGDALGGGVGDLASNGGLSALTNGAGDALAGTVSPLVVQGAAQGLTGGALGTALGGLTGSILGSGAGNVTGSAQLPNGQGNEVSPVTVTAAGPTGGVPIPGVTGASGGGDGAITGGGVDQPSQGGDGLLSRNNLLDLAGNTVGGVGADLGVFGLAQLLGLNGPGAPGGAVDGTNLTAPGIDGAPDPTSPDGTVAGVSTPPAGGNPGATFGTPGPAAGAGSGGALGQAMALANVGGGASGGAPLAAAPALNVRGSTAPDIYPWRGRTLLPQAEA